MRVRQYGVGIVLVVLFAGGLAVVGGPTAANDLDRSTTGDAEETTENFTTEQSAAAALSNLSIAGQGGTAGVQTGGELEAGDEVTVDLDNVGFQAWEVNGVSGAAETGDVIESDVNNPTLTLVEGVRYTFEDLPSSRHPLRLFDTQGAPLLSQNEAGQFEDDPAVDWTDTGDTVTFTLTPALAAELDGYICTIHSAMVGDVQTTADPAGESVERNATVNITNTGDQAGSFDVTLTIGTNISVTQSTGTVDIGQTTQVDFQRVTGGLPAGTYDVTVSAGQSSTSGSITVDTPASFGLSVDGTSASVEQGERLSVTAAVTNTGGLNGTQTVELDAGPLGTNTTTLSLAGGNSRTVTLGVPTAAGDFGTFELTLSTQDNQTTTTTEVQLPTLVAGPPLDGNDDGRYENVRGDNEFNILDVQELFNRLGSPAVESNAEAFDFFQDTTDEVNILDVQELFDELPPG